jgi:small-conductance mechanosensitive channel/CRP-like cAMP-binding protein
MILHGIEAVVLGLSVGLILWLIRRRAPRSRLRMWVLLAGFAGVVYLVLRMLGVPTESTGSRIALAATIILTTNTLLQILNVVLWDYILRRKKDVVVPRLVIDIVNFIVLAVVAVVVLNSVFGVRLTAFLVTSTVLSAVIGLSLQDILSNLFAGLALQMERPYGLDDWIRVGDHEGRVTQMNWRTLTVRTRENDYIVIPNATISKECVINYSRPNRLHMGHAWVGVAYTHPPGIVKNVVSRAVMETQGVQKDPCPEVLVDGFDDYSIRYDVRYWITDYERKPLIDDAVRCRIWYSLQRAGLKIPFPVRDVILHTVPEDHEARLREHLRREVVSELRGVDIFSPLSDAQIEVLAETSSKLRYAQGETLVTQGAGGDSLFIIATGTVRVEAATHAGSSSTVARLGPGSYFGEMSLLTGEPRSASVFADTEVEVIVVEKSGLAPLMESDSGIVEELSAMLEKRMEELSSMLTETRDSGKDEKKKTARRDDLLSRIRGFFGM